MKQWLNNKSEEAALESYAALQPPSISPPTVPLMPPLYLCPYLITLHPTIQFHKLFEHAQSVFSNNKEPRCLPYIDLEFLNLPETHFFPTAPVSPQACSKEDIDRYRSYGKGRSVSGTAAIGASKAWAFHAGKFAILVGKIANVLTDHQCLHFTEILRVSGMVSSQGFDYCSRIQQRSPSPMANSNSIFNVGGTGIGILSAPLRETDNIIFAHIAGFSQGIAIDRREAPPASPKSCTIKKVLRLEIPVDTYPNVTFFNFVGRLLGPRGNSLKRIEASTGCRVYIRGKGSIKDSYQVRRILQLPNLSSLRESSKDDSPHPSGSVSPFYNGMKRAKAGRDHKILLL
ncbi:hypothetical protein ZIOFF_057692 [Zingiber officinale]|uniref:KHDC4/BBP-like KH-domain type I domain-containing protein n=1 Tax=Zingiber officinale TaxID=94328 RepID=A0A8J5F8X5_ZINOF|nr:hypothetical protein ZIOFF_057692 [Zingiber officinale]